MVNMPIANPVPAAGPAAAAVASAFNGKAAVFHQPNSSGHHHHQHMGNHYRRVQPQSHLTGSEASLIGSTASLGRRHTVDAGVVRASNSHQHISALGTSLVSSFDTLNMEEQLVAVDGADLTQEERQLLAGIRRRKQELLQEIEQLNNEIATITVEMNRMESTEDVKVTSKQKQLTLGKKRFNMDPKKGIEMLVEHGLLKYTPEDVAKFLFDGEGLSKTAIGNYLGEPADFNLKVLEAFVQLHDFEKLILVQALRQFLWSFRLPGESQKIDRMMEKFSQRYCEQNPDMFRNSDVCYVLSFSIIMLNTCLHNPAVKNKPTKDSFASMNRTIDGGSDLPRELLDSLFDSIKQEPFKIPDEDDGNDLMHTFFNPDREGWLWKQGGRYKSWKRRWFILNDKCLYYFEYTTDKEPRGIIPLENVQVREVPASSKANCFELYSTLGPNELIKACKTSDDGRVSEGRHTSYRMYTATAEERDQWVASIKASISMNPYLDMLAARKRKAQYN